MLFRKDFEVVEVRANGVKVTHYYCNKTNKEFKKIIEEFKSEFLHSFETKRGMICFEKGYTFGVDGSYRYGHLDIF